jgi:hypothetical protein
MTTPLWLSGKDIRHLLNHVVDKLDAAEVQDRPLTRAIRLDGRTFPALYGADFEADKERLWEHVELMCTWGWFRLKLNRMQLGQAKYECNPRLEVVDAMAIRKAVGRPQRHLSASELWRAAVVDGLDADQDVRDLICRSRIEIPGRTPAEIVAQLNLLPSLRDEPLLLREVSARLFWGLSKVLDKRQALVAALLGLDECPFPEMPVQLQAWFPAGGFEGVLFIENQATFEQAIRDRSGRFRGLALVFASGFKGSAKRLRTKDGVSVYFSVEGMLEPAATQQFLNWLFGHTECPAWFWGDLDYAGMQILASLRGTFPGLEAWEPGYEPMLSLLKSGGGHAPESAGKQLQRQTCITGSKFADEELIPAMAAEGRFVDQEMV